MAVSKVMRGVTALAMVAALFPFHAMAEADKQPVQVQAKAKYATDRVLVKVKAGVDQTKIANKHGLKVKKGIGKGDWLVLDAKGAPVDVDALINQLKNDADVLAAEPDYVMTVQGTPNDPSFGSQWHLRKIQADRAWDLVTGTNPKTLAVIDTGVDLDHPEFSGRIVAGYDFVNNDASADDDQGHGTFVAGVAAAKGNNGYGGAGVDWFAKIMPVKALSANGSGYTSDIIDGIYYAADHGANVINMSIGGGGASSAFQTAINYAWNKGVMLVASVGSSGTSTLSYPAAYNNVFSVTATTSTDVLSSGAGYGSWVDIAAPGTSIYSTKMGGGMATMSGSSFSAAIVSGVATMTWAKYPTATNASIVQRLCSTADHIAGTGTQFICGRVNAYRAVGGI